MFHHQHLYIDGAWVRPLGTAQAEVTNPATEAVIGHIPLGDARDVDVAVRAARTAFEPWAALDAQERARWLERIHRGLQARSEEVARLISQEVGTPLALSRLAQAGLPVASFQANAALLMRYPMSEIVGHSEVWREPVGVVACITPWNYPLHQIAAKVAPALAAGCTVVVKPSELAPLSAYLLAEVVHEVGLPPGVFNLVPGTGTEVGEALAAHAEVDMVSLTGSTQAGRRVAELAARTVKRVALELGGKSAAILLDDADLATAVPASVRSCFANAGQTCTAHTRLLVSRRRYGEAVERAVMAARAMRLGDPLDETTQLGPVISAAQRERIRAHIRQGEQDGAELMTGGTEAPTGLERGYFVQPTVFAGVTPAMRIAQEEIFGPVLTLLAYEDEDEAVRIANDSIYGLGGAVWSADIGHARRIARRLRTGQVDINGGAFNLLAPFGGYKQSGHGRELGRYGLEEFLEVKSLQLPHST